MNTTVDITLPRDYTPIFPSVCVCCGKEAPDSKLKLSSITVGWQLLMMGWMPNKYVAIAPACAGCRRRRQIWGWTSTLSTIFGALLALWVLNPYISIIEPTLLRRVAQLATIGLMLFVQVLIEERFPPSIDITAGNNSVRFNFLSSESAIDFALANRNAGFILLNDEDFLQSRFMKIYRKHIDKAFTKRLDNDE
jgi:hypothetical protein